MRSRPNGCHFAGDILNLNFVVAKIAVFDPNFPEICYQVSDYRKASIDWNNGSVTKRQQSITLTNADQVSCRIYASLGLDQHDMVQICWHRNIADHHYNLQNVDGFVDECI